jgi:predicted ABC-type transport system involved in lysophospholipase L1 biosynthesis ATPase subunit
MRPAGEDAPLSLTDVEKGYGGLRPLRLRSLEVGSGTLVALTGLDAPAAEMFTNLATGALLPDRGEVRLFGRSTADVTDADDWLRSLDRVGILTDRAVLIDGYTAAQNLAMPLTLDVDPLTEDLLGTALALAREVGLAGDRLDRAVGTLGAPERLRIRFGRALALSPALLLMEHPTATLDRGDVASFARDVRRVFQARGLSGVAVTADREFASAAAGEVFQLRAADGVLLPQRGIWQTVRRLFDR